MINVQEKSKCCGCYACYNICPTGAISMEEDEKGFKYPLVNKEKCINCGLCEKACPIIKNNSDLKKNLPKAYACKNKNSEIRMKSSSGGIFTLISNYIFDLNGIVFGACLDEENNVIHSYVEREENIDKFRGSKYVQSSIGDTYKKAKEFLDNDRYVLFTGTPCQIEGLKSYLKKDYDKLYTQDIICHGVPSPKVWRKYIEELNEKNDGTPKKVNFRRKDITGWKSFQLSIKYVNSEYAETHKKDRYMQLFLKNVILRDSCYDCSFKKKNRLSDITLADFWGIENIKPDMDDDKGISLVIVNSEKGKELINKIESQIEKEEVDFEEAIRYNSSMIKSVEMPKQREEFFENLDKYNIEELVKKYVPQPNIIQKVVRKLKRIAKKIIKR